MRHQVIVGDVREIALKLEAESFDGCLCDPPYGLSFMGKRWDYDVPSVETWAAVLGALRPGAHLLAFAGTRTQHRMAVRIEDAGFEIRDMIAWVYGSGFPKSLDVSKAIDRELGSPRPVSGRGRIVDRNALDYGGATGKAKNGLRSEYVVDNAARTPEGAAWEGYGTALKPALEPITVARKPLRGTVAANVLAFGTGAINVDGCRVEWAGAEDAKAAAAAVGFADSRARGTITQSHSIGKESRDGTNRYDPEAIVGRWPANLIHDGSEEVLAGFPEQKSGANPTRRNSDKFRHAYGDFEGQRECFAARGADSGSAARFFYCAKASRSEREAGLEEIETRALARGNAAQAAAKRGDELDRCDASNGLGTVYRVKNHHPTVKPLALAEYLARLILPPKRADGKPRRLLVPFSGSGSEMIGALLAGWDEVVGIELSPEYAEIAEARIRASQCGRQLALE